MKYTLPISDTPFPWPQLHYIDWFKNEPDPLTPSQRKEMEKSWDRMRNIAPNQKNIKTIEKELDTMSNIIKQTSHYTPITKRVIDAAKATIKSELALIEASHKPNSFIIRQPFIPLFQEFITQGFCVQTIDQSLYTELQESLKANIRKLQQRPKEKMVVYERGTLKERCQSLDKHHLKIIHNIFNKHGIYDMANKYNNCVWQVRTAALHISRPDDEHNKQVLNDLLRDMDPKYKNMHIDPKFTLKCIIYLNTIRKDNGPFSYVQGSHLWRSDNLVKRSIAKGHNVYNISETPKKRREFQCLPQDLQVNANFGNYLLHDCDEIELIDKNIVPVTSAYGNLIFFDPEGIHLGGNVNTGERIAIQAIMRANLVD